VRLARRDKRTACPYLPAVVLLLTLAGCARDRAQPAFTPALRLVSTAPNLTEIICAVGAGDSLVGRTQSCDYPPECVRVPALGGFGTPNLEPLLAARPTHVLETVLADPDFTIRLRALNIPVTHIACSTLEEIPDAILSVGALTGCDRRAQPLAAQIRGGLASARNAPPPHGRRPRVALLFAADPPITAGRHAFVSELLRLAGGDNMGDSSAADYYHVSLESLLTENPDVLLCLFETAAREPDALFTSRTGWAALAAVRERRVYTVPDLNTVCRPGPRVLDGLAQLRQVLARDASRVK
jgi:iron complex transport system substrate-binding protein